MTASEAAMAASKSSSEAAVTTSETSVTKTSAEAVARAVGRLDEHRGGDHHGSDEAAAETATASEFPEFLELLKRSGVGVRQQGRQRHQDNQKE